MNSDLPNCCVCFGLYDNNNIVGFCGVLHQPHAHHANLKRCSRLVILPDYQGISLGTKFLSFVAKYFYNQGFEFSIVTSARNMIYALNKSNKWSMIRYNWNHRASNKSAIDFNRVSARTHCKTASFVYKGGD